MRCRADPFDKLRAGFFAKNAKAGAPMVVVEPARSRPGHRSTMTNRPRSHRIEDQSRIAFERLLPPEWVYRRLCPDYGIDGAVEIFDDGGRSTGRQFNV
jgi:hypothetical protein